APSPARALVTSITSAYQRPSPVPATSARHQRNQHPSPARHQCPSPVTSARAHARHQRPQRLSSTHARSCHQYHQRLSQRTSARHHRHRAPPALVHARACPAEARPNVPSSTLNALPRAPPSHPTLKHFPNSFLVSRG
ncbi:hypothetical protein CRG98_018637, partial [Punica granatum]